MQMALYDEIDRVREEALAACAGMTTVAEVEDVRVRYLGKKGELTQLLRGLVALPAEERPEAGKRLNEARDAVERALSERGAELARAAQDVRLVAERLDVTLPGRRFPLGSRHPLTQTIDEIQRIFMGMGFEVVEGPEVESDEYNFQRLNIPLDHPARDMQDTFYITDDILLRTQTSPVQIRVMEKRKPPVRVIAPGKVYRVDADITHSPMFHQVEGLLVDTHVTFADLKGTLRAFAQEMFGGGTDVRFRPSYFPFTEPSAEMDVTCIMCGGSGCRVCKHEGWVEILGAGMVHPKALLGVGYDPEESVGFAFGMGVERITMMRHRIDDIRLLFENDVRFLRQF